MRSGALLQRLRFQADTGVHRYLGALLLFATSIGFALFSTRELWNEGMLAFGDLARFPSNASAFANGLWDAWSDRGLGGPYTATTGILFAAALVAISGKAELAQQLYMTLWIPVAFCAMAYLCRRFVGTSWLLAAVGGLVYVVTPVSIGLVVGGAAGLIWAYALLPLVIIGAEKLDRDGSSAIGWFALGAALLAAFPPELLLFALIVLAVWAATGRRRKELVVAGSTAFVLAALAALPSLAGRGRTPLSAQLLDKVTYDFQYTYAELTPWALARFAGNQGDPMDPLGYNEEGLWTVPGYLPIAALILGLFLRRPGSRFPIRVALLAGVAAVMLFLIALVVRIAPGSIRDLSPILVFRNPGKPMMLFAVAVVPGAVYGLHRLFALYPRRRLPLSIGVIVGLLLYVGVYAAPSLTGHWGVRTVRDSFSANDELLAAAHYLKREEPELGGRWRVAWMPFDASDVLNLEWILPQWANDPVLESRDPHVEGATTMLENALEESDMGRFHLVADPAAVRYVVLRDSADPVVRRALERDADLERIHRAPGFEIWRNRAAQPRIRPFSQLTAITTPKRLPAVEYVSPPILRLGPNILARGTRWWVHPAFNFRQVGSTIRIVATHARYWPVLGRRFPVASGASYVFSARVRTSKATAAHLKVIWYRRESDPEVRALDHDYAEPTLDGDHPWTDVIGVAESPRDATYGEVAFLAGKKAPGSAENAVSWVRDIEVANYYRGDVPATPAEAAAGVLPEIRKKGQEFVEVRALAAVPSRDLERMSVTAVVLNPRLQEEGPDALRGLGEGAGRIEVASRADVSLQPRRGHWKRAGGSAQVVSSRGSASLPLGAVVSGRYFIAVTGCHLREGSIEIITPGRVLRPQFEGPQTRCGRLQTVEEVSLGGRTAIRFLLRRNGSVATVRVFPAGPRDLASAAGPLTVRGADSPTPSIRGTSPVGLTLADAFNRGWQTSGSGAVQFATILGFNGFVIDEPGGLRGLRYEPQQTRAMLLGVSALAWGAIAVLCLIGSRRPRWFRSTPRQEVDA